MVTYADIIIGNIAAARARRKLSQKALAERMEALGYGWRQQTVAATEGGRRGIDAEELLGLAYALETSVGVLLEPERDAERVMLPAGRSIDAASVAWSVRHFNDGTIGWDGSTPVFSEIPDSRRQRDVQDAAIGPMGRYGRYTPGRLEGHAVLSAEDFENTPPATADLDDWTEWKGAVGDEVVPDHPALEWAEPSESAKYEPVVAPWEILFGDGSWRRVALMGWSTSRSGQRVCDLSWRSDDGENVGGFHLFDPVRMRQA